MRDWVALQSQLPQGSIHIELGHLSDISDQIAPNVKYPQPLQGLQAI